MGCRTFKNLLLCMGSGIALAGLTACNVTDFSVAPESIAQLDKLDPSKLPDPGPSPSIPPACYPPSCAAPPAGCNYVNPVVVDGCLQSCGTVQCAPVPSPTPPVPTPTPTPVPSPTPPVPTPTPPVPSPTPTANVKSGSNEFSPPAVEVAPKVDLLFVVDNSGSMSDDQNILAQSFGDFIKAFKDREVDYQIGVTSTDTTPYGNGSYWNNGARVKGYINPGPGRLLSKFMNLPWVVPTDNNIIGHFTANAKLGTGGAGSEQGLPALELFLADDKIGKGGFNEGFIREDAMLSVVVVSDEDSDIKESGMTPEKLADRLIARLGQVKGPKSRGYSCDFVIDLNAKMPSGGVKYPLNGSMHNGYPNAYLKASQKMGCRNLDISKNWGPDLVKIGYDIINQAEKEFKLSAKPINGSIVVKIDGKVIAADASNGYVYHSDRQTIELRGEALRMSPGAKIVVDYRYLAQ